MKKIVRFLIASTFIFSAFPASAALISSGAYGNSVYDVYSLSGISWEDADAFALSKGGHLVTLTSSGENKFVTDLVRAAKLGEVWAGGLQEDRTSAPDEGWSWVTGETWNYTNWSDGEPNDWRNISEHYLGINWGNGKWNDERALGNIRGFVVENAVPEPSVIALFGLGLLGVSFARRRKVHA